jgi:hypothetical protein
MFSLKDFIKRGLLDAVGKMADYQVILNAAGWHEKDVLDEADLAEISGKIESQYKPDNRHEIADTEYEATLKDQEAELPEV